jgi:hypothetical protein
MRGGHTSFLLQQKGTQTYHHGPIVPLCAVGEEAPGIFESCVPPCAASMILLDGLSETPITSEPEISE